MRIGLPKRPRTSGAKLDAARLRVARQTPAFRPLVSRGSDRRRILRGSRRPAANLGGITTAELGLLTTAAVGIAAAGGPYVIARLNRDHERAMVLNEKRRNVYRELAAFLETRPDRPSVHAAGEFVGSGRSSS